MFAPANRTFGLVGHAQATVTEWCVHAAQVAFPGGAARTEERLYGAFAD